MGKRRWQDRANLVLGLWIFVSPRAHAEEWTRLVSVQIYSDAHLAYPGVRSALSECRAVLQASCPGAEWTVLRESEQDAVYEWRIAGCPAEPGQHEVGRVMHGSGTCFHASSSACGSRKGKAAGR